MKFLKVSLPLVMGLFALTSCDMGSKGGTQICDETMSLRTECVSIMAKALPAGEYSVLDPGSSQKLDRPYLTAPPNIPHQIEMTIINQEENTCLLCHSGMMEEIPAIPVSHKREAKILFNASAKPQVTKVTGYKASAGDLDQGRYVCTTCHVPQATNLTPLVKNSF